MTDIEAALERTRSKARGRTRYEGQKPYDDELMLAEIEQLRAWKTNILAQVDDKHEYVLAQLYQEAKQRAETAEAVVEAIEAYTDIYTPQPVWDALTTYDKARESRALEANND